MELIDFSQKTKDLIDTIKGICNDAGLGGDANEYKIVTQGFLYKFLNDKFLYEVAKLNPSIKSAEDLKKLTEDEYQLLLLKLGTRAAHLKSNHLLDYLFAHSNDAEFAKLFDNTLNDIAIENSDVFSVHTAGDIEIRLFEEQLIQNSVNDHSQHDITARKLINALANSKFDFDEIFNAGFDFFSTIFEYMIRDYNKDGGGKYAEYYTPHSIAHVMADILVGTESPSNVTTYDPAAGSGTLLMNLAHRIGPDNCTVYSQDMSQKSSNLLRLNLILNGLSHSIDHIVQGNTIRDRATSATNSTILSVTRRSNSTFQTIMMQLLACQMSTSAFLPVCRTYQKPKKTAWQSICCLFSTSCTACRQLVKRQSLCQLVLSPHKVASKRRYAPKLSTAAGSKVSSVCLAISLLPPAPTYRFYSSTKPLITKISSWWTPANLANK